MLCVDYQQETNNYWQHAARKAKAIQGGPGPGVCPICNTPVCRWHLQAYCGQDFPTCTGYRSPAVLGKQEEQGENHSYNVIAETQ